MGCGGSKSVEVNSQMATRQKQIQNGNNGVHKSAAEKITKDYNKDFTDGDRVHVRGYVGTVKFVGPTKLGDGDWVGIELDRKHPQGNNGMFKDNHYFTCKPKHGLFVRPEVAFHHSEIEAITELSEVSPITVVFIQTRMRRVLARIRLRKLGQRSETEKTIDSHVRHTSVEEARSINRLSDYLTKPFESDRHKAFAIYRWLTFNISYDVDGFFGRSDKRGCSAEDVLVNKTSVCAGYSNLYTALGQAAGLDIHTVNGYAKGYGHKPGQQFTDTNHAWNALNIDKQWYLSDATWGAGHVGKDMMFERVPNTHRFLMDPEIAIFDHLPEDDKWQFLDPLVDKATYERSAKPSGQFHEMGIEMESHKECQYEIEGDSIEMSFYCPGRKMILMGKLKNSSGQPVEGRERVQLRHCGINQVKMRAQFPEPGKYSVELYVQTSSENEWAYGLSYEITARKGCGRDNGGFPRLSSAIYEHGFDLEQPLENIETSNGKAEISFQCFSRRFASLKGRLQTLDGKDLDILPNQALFYSERKENGFVLKVHAPATGTYKLDIFANTLEEGQPSQFLCNYYVNNSANQIPEVAGFPTISDRFYSWGVKLVDPTQNIYSTDGKATIRIKTPEDVFNVKGHLKKGEENVQTHCLTIEEENHVKKILVHLPDGGVYTLNVFGTKDPENKNSYLLSYVIKGAMGAGKNPGFPNLSDAFHTLGFKLRDDIENITTSNEKISLTLQNPKAVEVKAFLKDANDQQAGSGACENMDGNVVVKCDVAKPGMYKLHLFGRDEASSKDVYLCTYKVLRD